MSIKSTLLISGLFLILCNQQSILCADFETPNIAVDEDFEATRSLRDMAALLEYNSSNPPSMKEDSQLPKMPFAQDLSLMAQEERAEGILKSMDGISSIAPSAILDTNQEDLLMMVFERKTQFSPRERPIMPQIETNSAVKQDALDAVKNHPTKEALKNELQKLDPLALLSTEVN
jgi:hypothetical protein